MSVNEIYTNYIKGPALDIFSNPKNLIFGSTVHFLSSIFILFSFLSLFVFFVILGSTITSESNFLIDIFKNNLNLTIDVLLIISGAVFGFFFIFSILLTFLINGYWLKTIKYTMNSQNIPDWTGVLELLKYGVIYTIGLFIIGIIFQSPFYMILLAQIVLNLPDLGILSNLPYVCSFLSWVYIPLGTLNYIEKNKFLALFNVKKSFKLYSKEYINYLVASFLLIGIYSIFELLIGYLIELVIDKVVANPNLITDPNFLSWQILWIPALYVNSFVCFTIFLWLSRGIGTYYNISTGRNDVLTK